MTTTVPRTFSVVEPIPASADDRLRPLSAFYAKSALVLLGEPGAGKTTAFREAAAAEADAIFVSLRDFLALSASRWAGLTLYLDGLDELRVKSADGASVLDQLRARLDGLGRPRFRLSCRAADWYGSSDVARLRLVAPDERVTVLRIDPLTDEDIVMIAGSSLSDPKGFLSEARARGIEELLRNPQTLHMVLLVVQDGRWPATRAGLYARATEILLRERNEEHARFQAATVPSETVMRAAQAICAIVLCAGAKGIALTDVAATIDSPFIGSFPAPLNAVQIAARSRLFLSEGEERAIPVHRTVAEYLAACDLTARIRDGLPLGRILSLLSGYDGRPVADLRGVFAWLATLSAEHQRVLIDRDPLGVSLYGAAGHLAPGDRLFLLRRLGELAAEDPWFRAGNWNAAALGELATPEMAEPFRAILEDQQAQPSLVASVLEAITYGHPLAQLQVPLLSIVRDASREGFLRVEALHALQHVVPENVSLLVSLLDDIHEGRVKDDERRLRGILLRALYPTTVSPEKVPIYLIAPRPHFVGEYTMFVEYELLRATPVEAIPLLADAMAKRRPLRRRDDFSRCIGGLLVRSLKEYGDSITPARLWSWLGMALGEHEEPTLDEQHQSGVRDWLAEHPTRLRHLYELWLARTAPADLWRQEWSFWKRIHHAKPGSGHGRWLLSKATVEADEVRADFLFRQAVRTLTGGTDPDAPTIDELFAFSEKNPRFATALQGELCWEIPDWRIDQAKHRQERRRGETEAQKRNVLRLSGSIDSVAAGTDLGMLSHLARIYFGLFVDVDRDKTASERVTASVGPAYVGTVLAGFTAVLRRTDLPSPRKIGRLQVRSQTYLIGYVVLAGCDLVAGDSMDAFSKLPPSTLKSGLAFHLANVTEASRPWVQWLKHERPDLAAEALLEFWEPQLRRDVNDVSGLYDLREPTDAAVARRLATLLLKRFPACREDTLRLLLVAALRHSDHPKLRALSVRTLRRPSLKGPRRLLWLATAFALAPAEFGAKVARAVRAKRERARTFVGFLFSEQRGAGELVSVLPLRQRTMLVRLIGPMFPPRDLPTEWQRGGTDWDVAQVVRGLIDGLSTDVTPAAGDALAELAADTTLSPWRDPLAHALGVQMANRREAEFRYPGIDAVIQTLRSGSPANAADLQALVATELRTVAEEIRHGVTDGYKAFWNVDPHGRPIEPRPEDDCRDRLLERLRPRLTKSEVALEPEGRYAQEKRADIKAIAGALNVPVEIKRHYHRDLWSAPQRQLRRLYARDPGTEGRGIFLVLWFGLDVVAPPKAPSGVSQPETADELLQALTEFTSREARTLTEIVLVDCSRPLQR